MLSIVSVSLVPLDLMGALWPTRSPLCGNALPDLDIREPTTTISNLDSFNSSDMAVLSSRVKVIGNSLALRLKMASGMRGALGNVGAALAKMKTVSSGATLLFNAVDRLTTP